MQSRKNENNLKTRYTISDYHVLDITKDREWDYKKNEYEDTDRYILYDKGCGCCSDSMTYTKEELKALFVDTKKHIDKLLEELENVAEQ